jgi:hypothetical protein
VHSLGGLNWKMDLPKPHSFTKMLGERPRILLRRQGIAYERIGKYHSGTIAYGCCRSLHGHRKRYCLLYQETEDSLFGLPVGFFG